MLKQALHGLLVVSPLSRLAGSTVVIVSSCMDFSEPYRYSGPQPAVSPDGKHVATVTESRLIIRNLVTTQVKQIYYCLDKISQVAWSPNSVYILCVLVKRSIVQVWSVHEPDWTRKIDEGLAGAERVCWTPDGLHVLVTADFQIR